MEKYLIEYSFHSIMKHFSGNIKFYSIINGGSSTMESYEKIVKIL